MRKFRDFYIFEFRPGFYLFLAVSLMLIPLKWILGWFFASTLHELFHILVIRLCKIPVHGLRFDGSGIILETDPMPWYTELGSALAGPLGSFVIILLSSWFPEAVICACIQSAYNLLPVFPLDGGRAFRCLSIKLFPITLSTKIIAWTERVVLGMLFCVGIYMSFWIKLGPIPFFAVMLIVFRAYKAKFPCKEYKQRVQ